jgi:inorganic pyrophosphatase
VHQPDAATDDHIVVVVEIPRGSRNKYEFDEELNAIVLDRRLFTSTVYPADYGFIDGTIGEDGDPLDALVLVGDPTFPGCRIRGRAVALFRMVDEKGPDDKLLCVPHRDPMWSDIQDVGDIHEALRAEIEQFFRVYKQLEGHATETAGFGDRHEALQVLEAARRRSAEPAPVPGPEPAR